MIVGWNPVAVLHRNHFSNVTSLSMSQCHLGISGNLVVKSKLPPGSGSSLEAVEPYP